MNIKQAFSILHEHLVSDRTCANDIGTALQSHTQQSREHPQQTADYIVLKTSEFEPDLSEKNSATVKIWRLKYASITQRTIRAFKPHGSQHNIISIKAGEKAKSLSLLPQGERISLLLISIRHQIPTCSLKLILAATPANSKSGCHDNERSQGSLYVRAVCKNRRAHL